MISTRHRDHRVRSGRKALKALVLDGFSILRNDGDIDFRNPHLKLRALILETRTFGYVGLFLHGRSLGTLILKTFCYESENSPRALILETSRLHRCHQHQF